MLAECLFHLNKLPNVSAETALVTKEGANTLDSEGKLILSTPIAFSEYVYLYKSPLNNANLLRAIAHLQSLAFDLGLKPLLVSKHISDTLMQKLIEQQIEFIDTTGNMYFNGLGVYIFIRGNRPSSQKKETSAFTTAGVKVIYTLLCEPKILESTYRDIATSAGVALGTANNVIRDLHKSGYLLRQQGGNYCIKDYQKLLSLWEFGYAEKLRSKLFIGNFSISKQKTFTEAIPYLVEKAQKENYLIGGELAASISTNYLRPQSATLHVDEDYRKIIIRLRLQPDPQGEVKILRTFGTMNGWRDCVYPGVVNPLLIRAELLVESSERLSETAEVLWQKFIAPGYKNALG